MAIGPDASYSGQTKIYRKQQPDGVTLNGAVVVSEEVFDVGSLITHAGQETYSGIIEPAGVAFTIAQDAVAGCDVTIQLNDGAGNAMANIPADLDVILSDSPFGVDITATAPSVSTTVKAGQGTLLQTYSANKAFYVQTNAAGQITIVINDAAHTGYYIAVIGLPVPFVSRQLVAGDYK